MEMQEDVDLGLDLGHHVAVCDLRLLGLCIPTCYGQVFTFVS